MERQGSEVGADAEHRAVLEHVELVAPAALALGIVRGERPIAENPGEGDTVIDAEVEGIAADGLPGEVAADAEAADVAAQEQPMSNDRSASWYQ